MCSGNLKLIVFLLLLPKMLPAQAMDETAVFRAIKSDSYLRFGYDNDFFTSDDKYYSQGICLEFFHPALSNNPLNKILFHFKDSTANYGLSVQHNVYTPNSIRHPEIIKTERPYTAALMLKLVRTSVNEAKNKRLTAAITLGYFGKGAFGKEMQKGIHKALNNIQPLGWENQLNNDVIINYEATIDFSLTDKKYFALSNNSQIRAGTFNNKASTGFTFNAGKINSPFSDENSKNNFHFYIYNQSLVNVIAYDATLQGGIFTNDNPHTLNDGEMSRITFQDTYGIIFSYRKIYLEYFQCYLSKEYKTGTYHRWGGIKAGLIF